MPSLGSRGSPTSDRSIHNKALIGDETFETATIYRGSCSWIELELFFEDKARISFETEQTLLGPLQYGCKL